MIPNLPTLKRPDSRSNVQRHRTGLKWFVLLLGIGLLLSGQSQEVQTLGGGPLTHGGESAGFFDGDTLQSSQFNQPVALAFDVSGTLYITDKGNNAIRQVDLNSNRTRTVITGFNQPSDLVFDAANHLYVLDQGSGRILHFDAFLNPMGVLVSGLSQPTAVALQNETNLWVAELTGAIRRIAISDGTVHTVASGFSEPKGIAVMDSGQIAISESGAHRIRMIDPETGSVVRIVGAGVAGFQNGRADLALFNQPEKLVQTPDGFLVVADRLNHRLRVVDGSGRVSTVYGIDPSEWAHCTECFPGWWDGSIAFAEAREPVGVAVNASGVVYTSEVFYHLIRRFSGEISTGPGSGGGGGGTGVTVVPPVVEPRSGYFPGGVTVRVTDSNDPGLLNRRVFYTVDGSEPTTNSFQLTLIGNTGTIEWNDPQRSLEDLRLKTFIGNTQSETVPGQTSERNEIGIPRDLVGGSGATLTIPIVVNLKQDQTLQSLQFRLEVQPSNPSVPPLGPGFDAFGYGTNDFVSLVTAEAGSQGGTIRYSSQPYSVGDIRGLALSWIGTNANLSISDFGVTTLIKFPVPMTAALGDTYRLRILSVSGTSDANQAEVDLHAMPDRTLRVDTTAYVVGDVAPGFWYDAAETGSSLFGFGDGRLTNADVNLAFNAALGVKVPFQFSDVFNAMDSFPLDQEGQPGGDGEILFLDWQVTLGRSLGLDPSSWERSWTGMGVREVRRLNPAQPNGQANAPAQESLASGWLRHASLQVVSQGNALPGETVGVPLRLSVLHGFNVTGMQFKAVVEGPEGKTASVSFVPSETLPGFLPAPAILPLNQTGGAWSLFQWNPGVTGVTEIGHLELQLPGLASPGDCFSIRLESVDGASSLSEPYLFETMNGCVRVGEPLEDWESHRVVSEQWKQFYFGKFSQDSLPWLDPDGDGLDNWEEFMAGTDPTRATSNLSLNFTSPGPSGDGWALTWQTMPGRRYRVEVSNNLKDWESVQSNIVGDGTVKRVNTGFTSTKQQMFRVRLD